MNVTSQNSKKSRGRDKCSFCNGEHFVSNCKSFANCSPAQKRKHATMAHFCYNCLSSSHTADSCGFKGRCLVCNVKHHTKLHLEKTPSSSSNVAKVVAASTMPDLYQELIQTSRSDVLATACVPLEAENGTTDTARA